MGQPMPQQPPAQYAPIARSQVPSNDNYQDGWMTGRNLPLNEHTVGGRMMGFSNRLIGRGGKGWPMGIRPGYERNRVSSPYDNYTEIVNSSPEQNPFGQPTWANDQRSYEEWLDRRRKESQIRYY